MILLNSIALKRERDENPGMYAVRIPSGRLDLIRKSHDDE